MAHRQLWIGLLVIEITIFLACTGLSKEYWPLTRYPMFSKVSKIASTHRVHVFRAAVVLKSGKIQFLTGRKSPLMYSFILKNAYNRHQPQQLDGYLIKFLKNRLSKKQIQASSIKSLVLVKRSAFAHEHPPKIGDKIVYTVPDIKLEDLI
jgi:hypothetical protein